MYVRKIPKDPVIAYKTILNKLIYDLTKIRKSNDHELSDLLEKLGTIREIDFALGLDEVKNDTEEFVKAANRYLEKKRIKNKSKISEEIKDLKEYSKYL